jgi:hypothetical protein
MRSLQIEPDRYARHCLEVMGVMDLPNMVLGRHTPCIGIWRQLRQVQRQWSHNEVNGVEPISGIPRTLLDICARIEEPEAESQFWLWHGQVGEFVQCQFWDAWRFAGMLDCRRRWQKAQSPAQSATGVTLPASRELLFRLLSAPEGIKLGLTQQENAHVLVANGTTYPWFVASIEVKLLNEQPRWKMALDRYHNTFYGSDPSQNVRILEQVIAEAQQDSSEAFDVDLMARNRSAELALF